MEASFSTRRYHQLQALTDQEEAYYPQMGSGFGSYIKFS
jgi:hypothetical protein